MHLRHKFGVLALIYVLSLTGTLATSVWCIGYYFHSALRLFGPTFERQNDVERLLPLVRNQRAVFDDSPPLQRLPQSYITDEERMTKAMVRLKRLFVAGDDAARWSAVEAAAAEKREAVAAYINGAEPRGFSPRGASAPAEARGSGGQDVENAFNALDRSLARLSQMLSLKRQRIVNDVRVTQERVLGILLVNAVCGGLLCVVGLVFVHRWVTKPVARLREATKHISEGEFSYRIETRSHDELGLLANEVNQMCATIVAMQTRLVEQERLAAAGEMVTRLAHNIRNPLGGLRGLAESTLQRHENDDQTAECQRRIIETVDRFEKWLRDMQQSVSPLSLNIQPADIEALIENVVKVLRPMADRRGVSLQTTIDPAIHQVRIDSMHLEQALVALMTNALQASGEGTAVTVSAAPDARLPRQWCLSVQDEGEGIPPELRQKIFLPYFTTKAGGNGLGLAMAGKVVKLHGGRLDLESEVGEGSRFTATMPGLVTED